MVRGRRALHCYVEDDTYEAWHDTASVLGVTTTALVEAIGRDIARVTSQNSEAGRALIDTARRVDAERRRRAEY